MKTTDTTNNQTAPFAPREAHQQADVYTNCMTGVGLICGLDRDRGRYSHGCLDAPNPPAGSTWKIDAENGLEAFAAARPAYRY